MKAFSSVRIPKRHTIKSLPIAAVIIDCLIVGGAIFYFTGPHTTPIATTPKVVAEAPAPEENQKVLGKSTANPATPPPSPGKKTTPIMAIIAKASDTTPFEPAAATPPPPTQVAVVPTQPDPTPTPTTPTPDPVTPPVEPPVVAPAQPVDFTLAITQPTQVAVGTLITLNVAQNLKVYYGGDLVVSGAVTLSRSGLVAATPVTVTTPDNTEVALPTNLTTGNVPAFSADVSQVAASGASFVMAAGLGTAPNGTYTVHIRTTRIDALTGTWQYDGFVTVTIVD